MPAIRLWIKIGYGILCISLATGISLFTIAYFTIDTSPNGNTNPNTWSLTEILTVMGGVFIVIGVFGLILLYIWDHLDELDYRVKRVRRGY